MKQHLIKTSIETTDHLKNKKSNLSKKLKQN